MRNTVACTVSPKTWILSSLEVLKKVEKGKIKNQNRIHSLCVIGCYIQGFLGSSGADSLVSLDFIPYI